MKTRLFNLNINTSELFFFIKNCSTKTIVNEFMLVQYLRYYVEINSESIFLHSYF